MTPARLRFLASKFSKRAKSIRRNYGAESDAKAVAQILEACADVVDAAVEKAHEEPRPSALSMALLRLLAKLDENTKPTRATADGAGKRGPAARFRLPRLKAPPRRRAP